MASIVIEPDPGRGTERSERDREEEGERSEREAKAEREREGEGTEEGTAGEEEPSTNTEVEDVFHDEALPTILKKDASPYITIFLGTNFIGILLWSTIEKSFPWFIYVSCPVAVVECFIYGLSKKMYFFITVSTYCNITILLFMTYLAIGGAYPWFIFPSFTLAVFPIIHYLYLHCREKKLRYFLIHISMYALANVQIFFAWVIHTKKLSNSLPWFIYPWGGWGLLLMIHYNYALMRNKNMLFIYMFLDAAGVVVITFRFTIGPIVLLAILAFLLLLLFYQLCLKKIILKRIHDKQLRAAQLRRLQQQQEQQAQQQINQVQQNQVQQINNEINNINNQINNEINNQINQPEQIQIQMEQENNSENQRLIPSSPLSTSSSFLPYAETIVLHPRRRRTRTQTSLLRDASLDENSPENPPENAVFTLPSYLLPSNYFHFEPPSPQAPPPLPPHTPPPLLPIPPPTSFASPPLLPFVAPSPPPLISPETKEMKGKEKKEDQSSSTSPSLSAPSHPSPSSFHRFSPSSTPFIPSTSLPLTSAAPSSSSTTPPPSSFTPSTSLPLSSTPPPTFTPSITPPPTPFTPSTSITPPPTPFTPTTQLPPPTTSTIPSEPTKKHKEKEKESKNKLIYLVPPPPGSPQLKPRRKKLRQPEGAIGSSTDGNNNALQVSSEPSSPSRAQSPNLSSPHDSDLDDLVVVEGDDGEKESPLDDF